MNKHEGKLLNNYEMAAALGLTYDALLTRIHRGIDLYAKKRYKTS